MLAMRNTNDRPDWLTVRDVAQYLRVTPLWVRRLIRKEGLPAYRLGGGRKIRLRREEVDEWLLSYPIDDRRNDA